MSTSRLQTTEGALELFGAGLLVAMGAGALLYFGFGIDLLATDGFGLPCVFRLATGFSCPGCGMTRALLLASQLQWTEAIRMNPLIFSLVGFAAYASRGLSYRLSCGERATRVNDS